MTIPPLKLMEGQALTSLFQMPLTDKVLEKENATAQWISTDFFPKT
jgi:hypothetical protein